MESPKKKVSSSRKVGRRATNDEKAVSSTTGDGEHSQNDSDTHSSPDKRYGRVNRKVLSKDSDEYKRRRERNNEAVKKSRHIAKAKSEETKKRVSELVAENDRLQMKAMLLTKELDLMKDFLKQHNI